MDWNYGKIWAHLKTPVKPKLASFSIFKEIDESYVVHQKAKRGVQEFVVVSHAIYLLETKFQVALRTATKLLPLVARQG
ncbi:hypothetical protein SAMN02745116_02052 [Pilibacter termitis]|uniref:Uncharacterized protein n=1 Tax=Pilibacter termitis TaxID=263852 RepID=A0A1T4Q509_9ENTE|nr:hypothetical protein [Pilibacter termitis]SJZ98298.1 hypothetical protein SAMN02745116_02052 [Pilibacter termitis]